MVGHAQVRGSLAAVGQRGGGANSKGLGIHYLRSSVCMTEWVGQGRRRNESELVKEIDNIHRGNVEPAFCNLDMRVHYRMCSTGCALQDVHYRMCITGCALQDVHYRMCSTGCAIQDVQYRKCSTGCAVQDVQYRMCSTGCAVQYVHYSMCTTVCAVQDVQYRMCITGCALQDVQYRMNTRSQGTRPTLQCLHNGGYRQQHTRSV